MADKTFSVMVNKNGVVEYPSNFITANSVATKTDLTNKQDKLTFVNEDASIGDLYLGDTGNAYITLAQDGGTMEINSTTLNITSANPIAINSDGGFVGSAIATTIGTSETSAKLPTEGAIVKALKNVSGGSSFNHITENADSVTISPRNTSINSETASIGNVDYCGICVSQDGSGIEINSYDYPIKLSSTAINVNGPLCADKIQKDANNNDSYIIDWSSHPAGESESDTYSHLSISANSKDQSEYDKAVIDIFANGGDQGNAEVSLRAYGKWYTNSLTVTQDEISLGVNENYESIVKINRYTGVELPENTTIGGKTIASLAGTPSNMVTTDTEQTITGNKTFTGAVDLTGGVIRTDAGAGDCYISGGVYISSGGLSIESNYVTIRNNIEITELDTPAEEEYQSSGIKFLKPQQLRIYDTVNKVWTNTYKFVYLAQDANGSVSLAISDEAPINSAIS